MCTAYSISSGAVFAEESPLGRRRGASAIPISHIMVAIETGEGEGEGERRGARVKGACCGDQTEQSRVAYMSI